MTAHRRDTSSYEIHPTDDGFKILCRGRLEQRVRWAGVRGIAGFRRDCFTGDQVNLAFWVCGKPDYVYINQDMPGFELVTARLSALYPGIDPNWERRVGSQPIADNWTVLWGDIPAVPFCRTCGYDMRGLPSLRCPECGQTDGAVGA